MPIDEELVLSDPTPYEFQVTFIDLGDLRVSSRRFTTIGKQPGEAVWMFFQPHAAIIIESVDDVMDNMREMDDYWVLQISDKWMVIVHLIK